jgi:preprotein translocase subunit SecD
MTSFVRAAVVTAAGLGCVLPAVAQKPDEKPKVKFEFRRAEAKPAEGLTEATVQGTTDKVYLHKTAELTAADVASAAVTTDPVSKDPVVEVVFTDAGAKKMAKLTEEHTGKLLAVVLDGKVLTAPVIRAKISARAAITGKFTEAEAKKLADLLNGK